MELSSYWCSCGRSHPDSVIRELGRCPFDGVPPKPKPPARWLTDDQQREAKAIESRLKLMPKVADPDEVQRRERAERCLIIDRARFHELLSEQRQQENAERASVQAQLHELVEGQRVVEAHEEHERLRRLIQRFG